MTVGVAKSDAPGNYTGPVGAPPEPVVSVAPLPPPAVVTVDTPCFVVMTRHGIIHDFTRYCPEYGDPRNGQPEG